VCSSDLAEELAAGCSGIASACEASELATTAVRVLGSKDKCRDLLVQLTQKLGFAGLALPNSHTETATLKAVQSPEGFIINGVIDLALNAQIADWLVLEAEIVPENENNLSQEKLAGKWAAFCLPTKYPGVAICKRRALLGRKAADISQVELCDVKITDEFRLTNQDDRLPLDVLLAHHNNPIIAAGCVGVARAALDSAVKYAKVRRTFGKAIAEHQAIAFMVADMARAVEAARVLTLNAAKAADSGFKCLELTLACKPFAQEIVMQVTENAVQIFGGYGYTKDFGVEKLMRDAKVCQLFYGTSLANKIELGRRLLA